MNIWLARLGHKEFNSKELDELITISNQCGFHSENYYQYKSELIHYVSFFTEVKITGKTYNYDSDYLRAYSGLLVNNTGNSTDFRHAKSLFIQSSLNSLATMLAGQFALIEANQNQFRCAIDAIGNHKVFYHTTTTGTCYITNYLPFLRPFKKREINYQFLIDFIANGGTYGIESEETNVYIIPASSEFTWNRESGLKIRQYYSLEEMLNSTESSLNSYGQVAEKFQHAANYLANHHNLVVPLSGGYDSRMILKMFRDKDLKNITTFTYSDHPYDMYLAKKVAHSKQLKHIEMKSVGELLSAEELHERVADNYPFISYSGVFAHQLNKDKYDLEDWDKVHIRGNTAVHAAIRKLNHLNVNDGEKAIRMLAENRVNSKLLNDFGRENSIKNFEKNYKEKYLNLYSKHENVHITKLHYIYEKFGNHQGYRYSFSRTGKPEDIYFPFADRSFLKLILSSEIDQYIKQDKNSIHHKLFSELDGCEIKKFPFSSGPHWDASKLERKIFRLRNKLKKRILAKIGIDDKKLSRQKQAEFMAANLPYFKEVVHSNPNSGLWDYIDRTNFTNWTSSEELAMKNMKPILRVIPYLKLGI